MAEIVREYVENYVIFCTEQILFTPKGYNFVIKVILQIMMSNRRQTQIFTRHKQSAGMKRICCRIYITQKLNIIIKKWSEYIISNTS